MNFLYDIFYEVLSEEGVWILILIASAFAVASFILLTLRMETNPKQSVSGQSVRKPKEERKRKKGKKIIPEAEESSPEIKTDLSPSPEPISVDETASEPKSDLPPNPEMTPPASFTHPEVILPGSAPYKNIPQPVAEQPSVPDTKPAPGAAAQASSPAFDPFDVTPLPDTQASTTGEEEASKPAPEHIEVPDRVVPQDEAAIAIPMEGGQTGIKSGIQQQSEEGQQSEAGNKSEGGDIFDLFEEVEEENELLSEFAKNLDEVQLSGLLTDTENLSQELKDIFTKHERSS